MIFTRQQLYDLVWTEPMRTLATRFQLSDVGLKKVCTKNRIPVPGRGYWQRLQAGKQDRRIPLPVIAASPAITFTLTPRDEETGRFYGTRSGYRDRKVASAGGRG